MKKIMYVTPKQLLAMPNVLEYTLGGYLRTRTMKRTVP